MRRWAALGAVGLAVFVAGCGRTAPDLFEVRRSGSIPGARLLLTVSDNGLVRCNRGPQRRLPDDQLLAAREIARSLEQPAASGLSLEPGPNSVLSYQVRVAQGTLTFSDTSSRRPELARVQAFTRRVAKDICGLPR